MSHYSHPSAVGYPPPSAFPPPSFHQGDHVSQVPPRLQAKAGALSQGGGLQACAEIGYGHPEPSKAQFDHADIPRFSPHPCPNSFAQVNERCFTPSPASTPPTTYSYGPNGSLTPKSSRSSLQTAPSVSGVSICHTEDSPGPSTLISSRPMSPLKALRSRTPFEPRSKSPFPYERPQARGPLHLMRPQSPRARPQSPLHRHQTPAPRPQSPLGPPRGQPNPQTGSRPVGTGGAGLGLVQSIDQSLEDLRQLEAGQLCQEQENQAEVSQEYLPETPGFRPFPPPNVEFHQGIEAAVSAATHCRNKAASPVVDEDMSSPKDSPPGQDYAPSPESQDDTMTGLSDVDQLSPASNDSDEALSRKAGRAFRTILDLEFDTRLGISQPPDDLIDDLATLLNRMELFLKRYESHGYVTAVNNPALSPNGSITTATSTGGANTAPTARKRSAQDPSKDEDYDDDVQDDDPDDDGGGADVGTRERTNRKKNKTEQFACPFRKRNPLRFNIRDCEHCCKAPFKNMAELKKHLRHYHQQKEIKIRCPRCHARFSTPEDCQAHLRQDPARICSTRDREGSPDSDAEETMTVAVGERLRSRAEHFTWICLWKVLFPGDKDGDIPSPDFEAPVELHEVLREHEDSLPYLQTKITAAFVASVQGGTPFLPGLGTQTMAHPSLDNVQNAVKGHMEDVFQRASINATGTPIRSRRTPGSQAPGTSTRRPLSSTGSRTPSSLTSPRPSSTVSASTASSSVPRPIRPGPPHGGRSTPGSTGTTSPTPSRHSSYSNLGPHLNRSRSSRGLFVDNVSDHGSQPPGAIHHPSMVPIYPSMAPVPSAPSTALPVPSLGMQPPASFSVAPDPSRARSGRNIPQLPQNPQTYAQRIAQHQPQVGENYGSANLDIGGAGFPDSSTMQFPLAHDMNWSGPAYPRPSSSPDDLTNCFPDTVHGTQASLDDLIERSRGTGWSADVLGAGYGAGHGTIPGRPGPGGMSG